MSLPVVGFETPHNLSDLLDLMNAVDMRLTLVDGDGAVFGHLPDFFGQTSGETVKGAPGDGHIRILLGNDEDAHVIYTAMRPEDAAAFLYGCFLGVFRGKRLETIHDEVELPFEVPPA